MNDRICG